MDGLVRAWRGILELYGQNNWIVTQPLINKLKDYIKIAEKFTSPNKDENYSGKFAQYMILLACDLANKASLSNEDKLFFKKYKSNYKTIF